jgi:hypothetical protein
MRYLPGVLGLALLVGFQAEAQDKTQPDKPKTTRYLVVRITPETGTVTELGLGIAETKTKLARVTTLTVTKDTKFVMVEGTKKTTLTAKTLLSNDKAKASFKLGTAVTVEQRDTTALVVTFNAKKK